MSIDLTLPLKVISPPTRQEFDNHYHSPQKPVIIRGLIAQQAAWKKWSLSWFKEVMGEEEIELFDNTNERHKWSHTTHADLKMKFCDYLDIIGGDEPTDLRMFVSNLYKLRPELKNDFSCPEIMKNPLGHLGYMFLGGKNTEVRPHFDIDRSCVLLTQVFGRKRVVLFGPEYSKYLYRVPFNTHTNVDLDHPDYDLYPALKYVKGYDMELAPGDSVYMPSGFWHYITYLEGGMGVSFRRLPPDLYQSLRALAHLTLHLPLDKALNRLAPIGWRDYKTRLMHKKAKTVLKKEAPVARRKTPA